VFVSAACFAFYVKSASLMRTAAYGCCKINLTSLESDALFCNYMFLSETQQS